MGILRWNLHHRQAPFQFVELSENLRPAIGPSVVERFAWLADRFTPIEKAIGDVADSPKLGRSPGRNIVRAGVSRFA